MPTRSSDRRASACNMRHILATVFLLVAPVFAQAAEKNYKITYIQGVTGNPFYMSVSCGAAEAAKRLGVTFDSQGPQQYTPALQMRVLDAVIAARPDGIMFTADDPVALTATLIEAKERGIKIISIDGNVKDLSVALANIQSDNFEGGRQAGAVLSDLLGGRGKVMALMNSPAANVAQQRLNGFKEEIAKHPGLEFLGVQYSNNQTAKAASIITSSIAANPDLAGVFTITTNNTEGAATGIREAQREGKVKIVGFDTSDPIVEAIRTGIVSADIVQYPYRVGQLGLETMVAALDGKPIEREITTPFVVATPQNIDTADVQKFIYRTNCR
ncbi:MAG: sugar ABC transporter substrate-binding protein [Oxalobacteraceae bacterium]|nr:MAG: sugar ABC transporter substrate-binding protein [Oxalobacteraceae bacterium]